MGFGILGSLAVAAGSAVLGSAANKAFGPKGQAGGKGGSSGGGSSKPGMMSYNAQGGAKYGAKGPSNTQTFGYKSGGGGSAGGGGRALRAITRSDLHPVTGQLLAAFLRAQSEASATTRKGSDVA
jgi:hypothetical protein